MAAILEVARREPGTLVTYDDLAYYEFDVVPCWVQDPHRHHVVWANDAACEALAAATKEELYSRDVSPILPATRLRVEDYLRRVSRGEVIETQWTTFNHKFQPLPILAKIHPYVLDDGLKGFFFRARDISDHTCAEALRLLEGSRHSKACMALFSRDGRLLERNVAVLATFGDLADSNNAFERLFVDREQATRVQARIVTTGHFAGRAFVHTRDGHRWHHLIAETILDPLDGQPVIFLESIDVEAEVTSELRAKESEQLLQQMADELPQPVAYITSEHRYRFVNRTYAEWVQSTKPQLLDKEVESIFGEAANNIFTSFRPMLEAGERISFEKNFDAFGNGDRWISVNLIPQRSELRTTGVFAFGYDMQALHIAQTAHAELERRLIELSNQLPVGVLQLDQDQRILFCNGTFCVWFGLQPNQSFGCKLDEVIGKQAAMDLTAALQLALEGKRTQVRCQLSKAGQANWFDITISPFRDQQQSATTALAVLSDVHHSVVSQLSLAQVQEELSGHLQSTPLAVIQLDSHRRIVTWSGRAESTFGRSAQNAFGKTLEELGLFDREQATGFENELRYLDVGSANQFTLSTKNIHRQGQTVFCEWYCSVVRDAHGKTKSFLALVQDVSERVNAQRHLTFLSSHDVLTGLSNRSHLIEQLREQVVECTDSGEAFCILFLDIDRFKFVNDALGHVAGDELLRQVSKRLQAKLPQAIAIARTGGNEFGALLHTASKDCDLESFDPLKSLHAALNEPYRIAGEGQDVLLQVSMGAARYPADGSDEQELTKRADWALYCAKDRDRGEFRSYSNVANASGEALLSLETELRVAVTKNEFELHYQPKIDLRSGRCTGAEALLRWRHPERGMVPPDVFIPLAEETGLIEMISDWVINAACNTIVGWQTRVKEVPQIAVNLSAVQLKRNGLAGDILRCLQKYGLSGGQLMVEVTETAMITDAHQAAITLQELRRNGVHAAIDDFGKGFSSLTQLRRLPIDALKIDGSFVRDLEIDRDDGMIVQAIIGLANNMRLKVIAEGIETEEQLRFLKQHGCDEGQGYLLGRPIPAAEFEEQFLQER